MYNKLLEEAGDFGRYQKCITCSLIFTSMVLVTFTYWTQVFILLVPPHRCKLHPEDTTFDDHSNFTDKCALSTYDKVLYEMSQNSSQYMSDLWNNNVSSPNTSCPYGYVYNFTDMYPTFATDHDLVCGDSWKMYSVHTCYWIGAMFGAVIMGFFSDKYGRRRSYQISLVSVLIADVTTYFSTSVEVFVASRFLSSFGSSNIVITGYLLAVEYTPPRYRLVNIAVLTFPYTLFAFLIPIMVYYIANWRNILMVCWIMPVVGLGLTMFVPESAVWLLTKKRYDQVAALIHRISKFNNKELSLDYIKDTLEEEYSKGDRRESLNQLSYSQVTVGIFKTPNMRRKSIILAIVWMMSTMSYTGNTLESMNLPFPWYLSFAIGGLIELPSNFYCVFCVDKIGKRWSNLFALVLGGILEISSWAIKTDRITLMCLAMMGRMCFAAGYDITIAQSSETFPTVVRGRGVAIMRAFGMIANAGAPMIVSLAEKDKLLPLLVFGILGVSSGILNMFLPETTGQQLPNTLQEGEEFGKEQGFFFCPFRENQEKSKLVDSERQRKEYS